MNPVTTASLRKLITKPNLKGDIDNKIQLDLTSSQKRIGIDNRIDGTIG